MADENEDLIELRRQYDDVYTGLNEYLGLGKHKSAGDDKVAKLAKPPRTITPEPEARNFELDDVKPNEDSEGFTCGACGESLDSEVAHCPHCGVALSWEVEAE